MTDLRRKAQILALNKDIPILKKKTKKERNSSRNKNNYCTTNVER